MPKITQPVKERNTKHIWAPGTPPPLLCLWSMGHPRGMFQPKTHVYLLEPKGWGRRVFSSPTSSI